MDASETIKPIFNLAQIAELNYQTPYFLFSRRVLDATIDVYKKHLPQAEIYYALKSNAEPEVLKAVHERSLGFEAASLYELRFLKDLNVPPEKIIYGTSVKPAEHIKEFWKYGVDRFALDSEQEVDKLAELTPGARVYARVKVDDSKSVFTMSAKFGTSLEKSVDLIINAKNKGLTPYGISFNVGSQALDPNAWAIAITDIMPAIESLSNHGIRLEVLNLGGGYPVHYVPGDNVVSPSDFLDSIQEAIKKLPYEMKIFIEPGRGLVADSMVLVTTVFAKVQRGDSTWLFLDAGTYNALLEAMAYQGSIRYKVSPLLKNPTDSEKLQNFVLTGPTGDSLDLVDNKVALPASIDVGDKLVIHSTGAYSLVLATRFNGFPTVPVFELSD